MQPRRPGLRDRADPGTRSAERVRGLFGVPSLDPAAAVTAAADPDPEPGHDRGRHPEIGLELVGLTDRFDVAAAARAHGGQFRRQRAVRHGWDLAVSVTAMSVARLTARPFRVQGRVALGERSRLPFPATTGITQQFLQLNDPRVTLSQSPVPFRQRLQQPSHLSFERRDPVLHQHILQHIAR